MSIDDHFDYMGEVYLQKNKSIPMYYSNLDDNLYYKVNTLYIRTDKYEV